MSVPGELRTAVQELTGFLDSAEHADEQIFQCRMDGLKLLTQRLEKSGRYTEPELVAMRQWFQESTDPWMQQSTMVRRARTWPEGYPGDYKTLEGVYANIPSGHGLARLVDQYFLCRTLAIAVRSRCQLLGELLERRSREESAGASWLNLACGPCRELLHLPAAKAERRIVCVDSDSNALDYARRLLDDKPAGACQFVEENAYRFSNAKRTIDRYGQFSTIYSAGLFDYIPSDKLAQLLRGLHESLAPGGLLLAPFKDQDRYETFDYHWFLKWHYFFQRSESEFWDVFAQAGIPKGAIKVERDATGVLLFFSVRKPF